MIMMKMMTRCPEVISETQKTDQGYKLEPLSVLEAFAIPGTAVDTKMKVAAVCAIALVLLVSQSQALLR